MNTGPVSSVRPVMWQLLALDKLSEPESRCLPYGQLTAIPAATGVKIMLEPGHGSATR